MAMNKRLTYVDGQLWHNGDLIAANSDEYIDINSEKIAEIIGDDSETQNELLWKGNEFILRGPVELSEDYHNFRLIVFVIGTDSSNYATGIFPIEMLDFAKNTETTLRAIGANGSSGIFSVNSNTELNVNDTYVCGLFYVYGIK